jgi:hypothetical protein
VNLPKLFSLPATPVGGDLKKRTCQAKNPASVAFVSRFAVEARGAFKREFS